MVSSMILPERQSAGVVSFPAVHPEPISQGLLAGLMALRRQRDALDAQIEAIESDVRAALEAGAAIEPGLFRAFLKQTERRNVAWREVAERLADRLGLPGYCDNVLHNTKPTVSARLVVEA